MSLSLTLGATGRDFGAPATTHRIPTITQATRDELYRSKA